MKQSIKQIIESINNEPEKWEPCNFYTGWDAVRKDTITVGGAGNTRVLSIMNVEIDSLRVKLSWWEKYRLEGAVLGWYKQCDLALLM